MREYMHTAIENALTAYGMGEVPVGAVIVHSTPTGESIVAEAYNTCKSDNNPLLHAEMKVLAEACRILQTNDLRNCALYVTLEPCPMCAGAILHSGISKVVFGAYDTDFGAFGSYINLGSHSYAKNIEIYGGICESECRELIKKFFREIRNVEH